MNAPDYNNCVNRYSDGLYRFMLKNTRDKDLAKDLVQDAFEKLWRKLNEVEAEKAKTYLFTTAYHAFIDHTRKQNSKAIITKWLRPTIATTQLQ